jgi:hypothetical protein
MKKLRKKDFFIRINETFPQTFEITIMKPGNTLQDHIFGAKGLSLTLLLA